MNNLISNYDALCQWLASDDAKKVSTDDIVRLLPLQNLREVFRQLLQMSDALARCSANHPSIENLRIRINEIVLKFNEEFN